MVIFNQYTKETITWWASHSWNAHPTDFSLQMNRSTDPFPMYFEETSLDPLDYPSGLFCQVYRRCPIDRSVLFTAWPRDRESYTDLASNPTDRPSQTWTTNVTLGIIEVDSVQGPFHRSITHWQTTITKYAR